MSNGKGMKINAGKGQGYMAAEEIVGRDSSNCCVDSRATTGPGCARNETFHGGDGNENAASGDKGRTSV